MNYGQIMVLGSPILAAIAGVFLAYWITLGLEAKVWLKIPRYSRDPRWKNRNQTVDFIFASFTILSTLIIAIIGATLP